MVNALVGKMVSYTTYTRKGELRGEGLVIDYIGADREDGERFGAFIVRDRDTNESHECDERDVHEMADQSALEV